MESDDPDTIERVTWNFKSGFFEVWLAPDSIANSGFFNTGPDRNALREHIDQLRQFGWESTNMIPHGLRGEGV